MVRASMKWLLLWTVVGVWWGTACAESSSLPSLYEYYTAGGIRQGLVANNSEYFELNGKPFVIFGGSLHYFRIVPEYWQQTLLKFKAAGLNSVQFYVPWNLNELNNGTFDFDSSIINLEQFLIQVRNADMFAVARIGPFICAEWEFGGFPSWLLKAKDVRFRVDNPIYIKHAIRYYEKVLAIINRYQFSTSGGPVIALQLENEYHGFTDNPDYNYLFKLKNATVNSGFKQLLFMSDGPDYAVELKFKRLGVLHTANCNNDTLNQLLPLKKVQANKPIYVSEFWPGWFDNWNSSHNQYSGKKFIQEVGDVLFKVNGSINFYMFMGGTNFGFMNGGIPKETPDITSYDYDAPLTEYGNYTDKYWLTLAFARELVNKGRLPRTKTIDPPAPPKIEVYKTLASSKSVDLLDLVPYYPAYNSIKPVGMEYLNQKFGFILYRLNLGIQSNLSLQINGPINDRAIVLLNGQQVHVTSYQVKSTKVQIEQNLPSEGPNTLDILVENMGRSNWGRNLTFNEQTKGIEQNILINNQIWNQFQIYSLTFGDQFWNSSVSMVSSLVQYKKVDTIAPRIIEFNLNIVDKVPNDTFLNMSSWNKGNVFVNGFNIGRFYRVGPQQTLYLPGPLLRTGNNVIHVLELHSSTTNYSLSFTGEPILNSIQR